MSAAAQTMTPVSRVHIPTEFSPACCDGAPFLPESVIASAPEILKGQVSDAEWSVAMRHLQTITMEGVPSHCTQFSLRFFFGLCGAICIGNKYDELIERLTVAVKEINTQIFTPKGLYMALQCVDAGCCSAGKNVLVLALTPEESKILQQEGGIH